MDFVEAMKNVIKKQQSMCDWTHGRIIMFFVDNGYPCVKFKDGEWWHYDLPNQSWW
jgi:hypothetical protein